MTEADQLVGATIAGKYRIRRLIGAGGMGSVYEGQHLDLGKKVAVKILDAVAHTSAELATRFKREARAASAVESDGIVQVFDVGQDPEIGLYMVMEFLSGEDLEMRLRRQPGRRLDPVVVAHIGHQVARALVKAHAARVIHRDLKPANIFLTDRDDGSLRVKILDFGISKLLASEASAGSGKEKMLELTAAGMALGTPQYMAPEQAQGLTTVDHRADIWGLGVVLYEALAGIPAFPELGTYQETIINLLQGPPQPLAKVAPWVPEALAAIVHQALAHDVKARIQDCATFAARLGEALPGEDLMHRLSSHSDVAFRLPPGGVPRHVVTPAPPVRPNANGAKPITLGDDTQVVVRASDEAPISSADPTLLQGSPWVEPPEDGPATLKTGLSLAERPTGPPAYRSPGVRAGFLSGLGVVVVGGSLLLLARVAGTAWDTSGGASGSTAESQSTVLVAEPSSVSAGDLSAPSPPATGTTAIPVPPATGAAIVENVPLAESIADASSPVRDERAEH
jgi:eukaryotic-like serine/threonine-protein kinase